MFVGNELQKEEHNDVRGRASILLPGEVSVGDMTTEFKQFLFVDEHTNRVFTNRDMTRPFSCRQCLLPLTLDEMNGQFICPYGHRTSVNDYAYRFLKLSKAEEKEIDSRESADIELEMQKRYGAREYS
jgi:hypothetical protein